MVVAYNQLSEIPGGFYWGGWISILCMSVFMFFCAIGFATQPWTICTEIFPQNLKGMALSFCMLASWGFNYVTASWFPQVADGQMGKVIMYVGIAIACVVAYIFTHRYIPETKGFSQQECVTMILYARDWPVDGAGGGEEDGGDEEEAAQELIEKKRQPKKVKTLQ